jgi:hypothetical protein
VTSLAPHHQLLCNLLSMCLFAVLYMPCGSMELPPATVCLCVQEPTSQVHPITSSKLVVLQPQRRGIQHWGGPGGDWKGGGGSGVVGGCRSRLSTGVETSGKWLVSTSCTEAPPSPSPPPFCSTPPIRVSPVTPAAAAVVAGPRHGALGPTPVCLLVGEARGVTGRGGVLGL